MLWCEEVNILQGGAGSDNWNCNPGVTKGLRSGWKKTLDVMKSQNSADLEQGHRRTRKVPQEDYQAVVPSVKWRDEPKEGVH